VRSFEHVAARSGSRNFNLADDGDPERIIGEMVESAYFPILGLTPLHGRVLHTAEDEPGVHDVAIISHALWTRRVEATWDVVGRTLRLDGRPFEIIGVLPEGFRGLTDEADVWLPLPLSASLYHPAYMANRKFRWLSGIARLRPGASVEAAQQEINAVAATLERDFPDANAEISADVQLYSTALFGDLRSSLLLLSGAAGFVLLIACTNVANLLLSRAVGRRREVAVRTALGASRITLLRGVFVEAFVLAAMGCALGLMLARWATQLLVSRSAVAFPSWVDFGTDMTVIVAMAGLATLAALLFAALPGIAAARVPPGAVIKESGRGSAGGFGRLNAQGILVVAEVALAMMLFVGAGLMVKGFRTLREQPLGFRSEELLTLRMDMKGESFAADESYRSFARGLVERAQALPGVRVAAVVGPGIPGTAMYGFSATTEERIAAGEPYVFGVHHLVSPGFFEAMGVPLVRGRAFTDDDYDRARSLAVTIISERLAEALWPREDPIGRRIRSADGGDQAPWMTVVGVAGDVVAFGVSADDPGYPAVYIPIYQALPRTPATMNLLLYTDRSAAGVLPALREEMMRLAPQLPFFDVRTMDQRLDEQSAGARFLVLLIGLFSALALILATIGIYGVISYAVAQQVRDIGIRMALGAERRRVVALVLMRGLRLAAAGVLIGVFGAAALTRLLSSALYGVSPLDPQIFALTGALLLVVAAAAAAIPAWRAATVDPILALRTE
jgi:putative ABC transport system permease protein